MNLAAIAGIAHEPDGKPKGTVVLTHGAGGSRESALLTKICEEWARRGWLAVRYNLPYRRRRPKGPPSGSAAGDREGIVEAVATVRPLAKGPERTSLPRSATSTEEPDWHRDRHLVENYAPSWRSAGWGSSVTGSVVSPVRAMQSEE